MNRFRPPLLLATLFFAIAVSTSFAQAHSAPKTSRESRGPLGQTQGVSKTTATLQVVVNPPLRRGSPIHDNAFRALHDIQG